MMRVRCCIVLLLLALSTVRAASDDSLLWVGVQHTAAMVQRGQADTALDFIRQLLPLADSLHQRPAMFCLHAQAAMCLEQLQQTGDALHEYQAATALCEQASWLKRTDGHGRQLFLPLAVTCYTQTARLAEQARQQQTALSATRQCVPLLMACRDSRLRTSAILSIGDLLTRYADRRQTEQLLRQAYADAKAAGRKDQVLMAATQLLDIGVSRQLLGDDLRRDSMLTAQYGDSTPPYAARHAGDGTSLAATAAVTPPSDTVARPSTTAAGPSATVQRGVSVAVVLLVVLAVVFVAYAVWQRRTRHHQADRRYIEGQEEERQRLARELHDGVSNQLLAIQMKLNSEGPTEQALQLLDESREQVRRVSHELMPPAFAHATIDEVIAHYVSELNDTTDCDITCHTSTPEADWSTLTDQQSLAVYRIVQEAVGNALRHAGATAIAVGMHRHAHQTTIVVSDNGTATPSSPSTGIGLRTMQQRAAAIGATLRFTDGRLGHVVTLTL